MEDQRFDNEMAVLRGKMQALGHMERMRIVPGLRGESGPRETGEMSSSIVTASDESASGCDDGFAEMKEARCVSKHLG